MADLADFEWLTGPEAAGWLDDLTAAGEPVHRQLNRLRKSLTAERARLVVGQIELRQRAVVKFGELAAGMFFTNVLLQQATDIWTGHYKASRVPSNTPVADYCCGIGGDLLAFALRGSTTGWDRDPESAHLANANLQSIEVQAYSQANVGLVEAQTPRPEQFWHLDPDRRSEGRRSTQLQWHSPGPGLVDRWRDSNPNGILKLAPAAVVPENWADEAELEWISRDRQCRQLVVWFGALALARGQRRATVLQKTLDATAPLKPVTFVGSSNDSAPTTAALSRYIYDTDPAIRAAGLTGAIALAQDLCVLRNGPTYLTSDKPVDHPLLARFEVDDQFPLRINTLSKHLRRLGIGRLEIKKRGVEIDPERLRKQLKLHGDNAATLLLTRVDNSEIAVLAKRCQNENSPI